MSVKCRLQSIADIANAVTGVNRIRDAARTDADGVAIPGLDRSGNRYLADLLNIGGVIFNSRNRTAAAWGQCRLQIGPSTHAGQDNRSRAFALGADNRTQLEFVVPSRGLIGFRGEFIRATRGAGIMSHSFFEYRPMQGDFDNRRNGVLIAFEEGTATFYALKGAEDRGQFFITPGTKVYKGMIIGENTRQQDMEINICKAKQVTNIRSAGADVLDSLQSPIQMTLERALEYIGPDEMLEVTPESMRLRKLPAKKMAKR